MKDPSNKEKFGAHTLLFLQDARSLPLGGKSETPHGEAQTEVPEITFDNAEEAERVEAGDFIPGRFVRALRFVSLFSSGILFVVQYTE